MEAGTRDNELVSEVTTLLSQHAHIDPMDAVQEIIWKKARAYRVSITIGDKEFSKKGRKDLFKGYEKIVLGKDVHRRRAETLYKNNLREWMEIMAKKAIDAAIEMEAEDV